MKILAVDLGKVKSAARRTMIKNTIHAILDRQAISMPSGKRAWTNAGRKWLERQARAGDVPFAAHRGRSSRR